MKYPPCDHAVPHSRNPSLCPPSQLPYEPVSGRPRCSYGGCEVATRLDTTCTESSSSPSCKYLPSRSRVSQRHPTHVSIPLLAPLSPRRSRTFATPVSQACLRSASLPPNERIRRGRLLWSDVHPYILLWRFWWRWFRVEARFAGRRVGNLGWCARTERGGWHYNRWEWELAVVGVVVVRR